MSTEKIQIVASARDDASPQIKKLSQNVAGLRGQLLQVTKDERLLKRTTRGVYGFASALDVVGNTRFSGLINDLTTVGVLIQPLEGRLTKIATDLGTKFSGAFNKAASSKVGRAGLLGGVVAAAAGVAVVGAQALQNALPEEARNAAVAYNNAFNEAQRNGLSWNASEEAARKARDQANFLGSEAGKAFLSAMNSQIAANLPNDLRESLVSTNLGAKFANDQALIRAGLPIGGALAKGAAQGFADGYVQEMSSHDLTQLASEKLARGLVQPFDQAGQEAAQAFGDRLSDNLREDLKGTKGVVRQAWKDIKWALNHPDALKNKLGSIDVILDSSKLQQLLDSKNPQQALMGRQIQARLTGQFETLTGTQYQSGVTSIVSAINGLRGYLHPAPSNFNPPTTTGNSINYDGFVFHRDAPYNPPRYAKGGYMAPGKVGMVGENGPEFVRAGKHGATISPSNGGGHGHAIILNGRLLGQAVDEYLGRQLSLAPSGVINRG